MPPLRFSSLSAHAESQNPLHAHDLASCSHSPFSPAARGAVCCLRGVKEQNSYVRRCMSCVGFYYKLLSAAAAAYHIWSAKHSAASSHPIANNSPERISVRNFQTGEWVCGRMSVAKKKVDLQKYPAPTHGAKSLKLVYMRDAFLIITNSHGKGTEGRRFSQKKYLWWKSKAWAFELNFCQYHCFNDATNYSSYSLYFVKHFSKALFLMSCRWYLLKYLRYSLLLHIYN